MGVKLSSIQAAARAEVKPYQILDDNDGVIVELQPILLLPKEQRHALAEAGDFQSIILRLVEAGPDAPEDDRDLYDLMREVLRLAVFESDAPKFEALEAAIGDDPLTWKRIFESYSELTKPGEAKSSEG